MKIIIEDADDWLLQVRAARSAISDGIREGGLYGIAYADGSSYGVKRNKNSVRVYRQEVRQPKSEQVATSE